MKTLNPEPGTPNPEPRAAPAGQRPLTNQEARPIAEAIYREWQARYCHESCGKLLWALTTAAHLKRRWLRRLVEAAPAELGTWNLKPETPPIPDSIPLASPCRPMVDSSKLMVDGTQCPSINPQPSTLNPRLAHLSKRQAKALAKTLLQELWLEFAPNGVWAVVNNLGQTSAREAKIARVQRQVAKAEKVAGDK